MKSTNCLFCDIQINDRWRIVSENGLAYAVGDDYPVRNGHTLLIPKRHVVDYFELTEAEVLAIHELMVEERHSYVDILVEGFNISINCGSVAGQSIFHCYVELSPRYFVDVAKRSPGLPKVITESRNHKW